MKVSLRTYRIIVYIHYYACIAWTTIILQCACFVVRASYTWFCYPFENLFYESTAVGLN